MKYYLEVTIITKEKVTKKFIRELLKSLETKRGIEKITVPTIEEN